MDSERRLIALPGGRDVDVLLAGPAGGLPLVLHEGTPIGLVLYTPTAEAAASRNLRIVLVARPGYERSTPRPGRRVVDVAADVAGVLDELGLDTFITAGWSGGGAHALSCAAALPGRCLAAASIAGTAPYGAKGLDFSAGMGPENVAEFAAAVRGPAALTEFLDREAASLGTVTGAAVAASLGGLISPADSAALTGEFADYIAAGLRAAVSGGVAGWRDDDLAFVKDWGFSLGWDTPAGDTPAGDTPAGDTPAGDTPAGDTPAGDRPARDRPAAPVAIWQGDQDRMVPLAHGQWLAAHIPGARVHLLRGEGHLTLTVTALGRILDDLLDLAGLRP